MNVPLFHKTHAAEGLGVLGADPGRGVHAASADNCGATWKRPEGRAPAGLPPSALSGCARVLVLLAVLGAGLTQWAPAQDALQPTATLGGLPAGILASSPLAQVVKLAQAGVDEGIINAFVTNSASTFNLDSDKIIYLKDIGVPNDLVKAMMQRDNVLQAYLTTAASTQPPLPQVTPTPPPVEPATPPVPSVEPTPPPLEPTPPPLEPTPPPLEPTPPPLEPTPPPLVADDSPADQSVPAPAPALTVNSFYDALAPYGNWVVLDGYGRCWQPNVTIYHHDWQPYGDHGHWIYTDSGWYWTSDYSWGWAPFHYGRWFHHDRIGWCWCPDLVWGPSWVTWRYSDDYCGWAPLPPGAYYEDGVGFVFDGGAVGVDFDFGLSPDYFVFVSVVDFCDPHPLRHRIDRSRTVQVYHQTVAVNHFEHNAHGLVNHGIDPVRITRVTHTAIHPIALQPTGGAAGRVPPGTVAARANGAVNPNRLPAAPGQNNNLPPSGQYPGPDRAAQPRDWQTSQRAGYPTAAPNNYNNYTPPANQLRPSAPVEVYRPSTPAPEPRQMEPRQPMPMPEPRQVSVAPPERHEPQPAAQPAESHNNPPPAAAPSASSKSGKNGN